MYCHLLLCYRQLLSPKIRDKWSIELVCAQIIEKLHQTDELTSTEFKKCHLILQIGDDKS